MSDVATMKRSGEVNLAERRIGALARNGEIRTERAHGKNAPA